MRTVQKKSTITEQLQPLISLFVFLFHIFTKLDGSQQLHFGLGRVELVGVVGPDGFRVVDPVGLADALRDAADGRESDVPSRLSLGVLLELETVLPL